MVKSKEYKKKTHLHRKPSTSFDENASSRFAARILKETKVSGAIIGRFAVWAWVPLHRQVMTKDLDIAVAAADLPIIDFALTKIGMKNRILPIGGVNARHEASGVNVDFITRASKEWGNLGRLYSEAVQAAQKSGLTYEFEETILPLVPPEYIIVMKLATGEHDDERDAVSLLTSAEAEVDVEIVRDIVIRLVPLVRGTLERTLREAGHPAALPISDSDS